MQTVRHRLTKKLAQLSKKQGRPDINTSNLQTRHLEKQAGNTEHDRDRQAPSCIKATEVSTRSSDHSQEEIANNDTRFLN